MPEQKNEFFEEKRRIKAQSAIEYLITYGWAIIIISLVGVVLYIYVFAPSSITPISCTFTAGSGAACEDMVFGSNTAYSIVGILLSNAGQYPLLNPSVSINITSVGLYYGTCIPSTVLPGGSIICNVTAKTLPLGALETGKISLIAVPCQSFNLANCASLQKQTYVGQFTTHVSQLASNSFTPTISLSSANPTFTANGTGDELTATVQLLGFPLSGASVSFSSNTAFANVSPTNVLSDFNGHAVSYTSSKQTGSAKITATFGTVSANTVITFVNGIITTTSTSSTSGTTTAVSAPTPPTLSIASNPVTYDVSDVITGNYGGIDSSDTIVILLCSGTSSPCSTQVASGTGTATCNVASSCPSGALASGTYNVIAEDTTQTLYSAPQTLIVSSAAFSVLLSPSNAVLDGGQTEVYTATVTGGTSPYTYNFFNITGSKKLATLSNSLTTNTFSFVVNSPTMGNSFTFNVIVTDSSAIPLVANSVSSTIKVSNVLVANAITPVGPNVPTGGSITLTANPAGGTTPYTYQWYTIAGSTAPTCTASNTISGATSNTYFASPASTNSYAYQVTDVASVPVSKCSAGDTVTVGTISFAIDGSATCNSGNANHCSMLLTTTTANDLIIVITGCTSGSGCPLTISANSVNTGAFTFITSNTYISGTSPAVRADWAIANQVLTNGNVMCGTSNANSRISCVSFAVKGANIASPIDANTCNSVGSGTTPTCSLATTFADDMLIGAQGVGGAPASTSNGVSFKTIKYSNDGGNGESYAENLIEASTGTYSVNDILGTSETYSWIGFAIK